MQLEELNFETETPAKQKVIVECPFCTTPRQITLESSLEARYSDNDVQDCYCAWCSCRIQLQPGKSTKDITRTYQIKYCYYSRPGYFSALFQNNGYEAKISNVGQAISHLVRNNAVLSTQQVRQLAAVCDDIAQQIAKNNPTQLIYR